MTHSDDIPLTEPLVVSDTFVTGAAVEFDQHVIRIVGWVTMPDHAGAADERRVVTRLVMPIDVALKLRDGLARHISPTGDGHAPNARKGMDS